MTQLFKIITKWFISSLVFAPIFCSCEKIVVLDVKSSDSKVVVQAYISTLPGPYIVKLDNSITYYEANSFPAVTGAVVSISSSDGVRETLSETMPGIYKTNTLMGVSGKTYTLEIIAKGKTYTASEKMPDLIPIDSFNIYPQLKRNSSTIDGYRVNCKFTDPLGVGNYYKVVISSNDTAAIGDRDSRIVSDKLTDGQQISVTFRTKLMLSDTVTISLQSITKSTYDFFNTISNAQGEVGASQFLSSLPANPINNVINGLGYFSAYAEVKQTNVVQPAVVIP